MDKKVEILLGSQRNVDSVNVDSHSKIELTVNEAKITEFTVNDVVNSTEVFDAEREAHQIYRIYGRIEYLSLLNGLKSTYSKLEDFFYPLKTGSTKTLLNSFKFYLVAPHSGSTYTKISGTDKYRRSFLVLTNEDEIEIFNAGFTNNVYGEQVFSFNFKLDFDVSEYYDYFGFPLTELFLYVQYVKDATREEMSYTTWSTTTGLPSKSVLNTKVLEKGDEVENASSVNIGDVIEYLPEEYFQTQVEQQKFFIRTKYFDPSTKWLEWSYNPFIPLRLRYFDSVISTAKLPEIVENSTTLDVYLTTNPSFNISMTKTKKQSITTSLATITNWNSASGPFYSWNANTGELTFLIGGTYHVSFKTQIYLPNDTDKYIGETYFETGFGSEIPNTKRKYQISNAVEGTILTGLTVGVGDIIRIKTRLIPNPNIRKMFIIPDYALMRQGTGKYVWRDILPQGYIDPLTGEGVDYPFFNNRRYLFAPIVLDVYPNLSEESWETHPNTITVFNEISYSKNATDIDITPIDDDELNNIGKPCQ